MGNISIPTKPCATIQVSLVASANFRGFSSILKTMERFHEYAESTQKALSTARSQVEREFNMQKAESCSG
jgi:hypothetical protein